jgi:hypothetical protein
MYLFCQAEPVEAICNQLLQLNYKALHKIALRTIFAANLLEKV